MDNYYIGEICVFGGNFAPDGWVFCDGRLLSIAEHSALYSLISTYYGGDGRDSFAVPDLRQRIPVHRDPADDNFRFSFPGGDPNKLVTTDNMPSHSHVVQAVDELATNSVPNPKTFLAKGYKNSGPPVKRNKNMYGPKDSNSTAILNPQAVSNGGGPDTVTLDNHQPYLVCNYIIATEYVWDAVYPNRS